MPMRALKSGKFWAGFVVGAVVSPWLLSRFAPGIKSKIPQ